MITKDPAEIASKLTNRFMGDSLTQQQISAANQRDCTKVGWITEPFLLTFQRAQQSQSLGLRSTPATFELEPARSSI
jgi:hypothetical protein